ncbi:hypothetical protein SAMN05428967_2343 [Phyllobacterium sp. YR620]|uniref:Holotricin-3 precursor n=1 Tax=Phyllobacterium sp. YR620 TaxID=1881066 RepID=UPI00088DE40E|nr:Holotricin-3 precursor [Phyllobacterium sp. YR620]SDP48635.1 hypothetical protein SAMN05428967_2343 [Phyllobacterium sp. YR620]
MKRLRFILIATASLGLMVAGTTINQINFSGPAFAEKGGNGNGGNGHGGGNGNGGGQGNGKGNTGASGKSSSSHGSAASAHNNRKTDYDRSKVQRTAIDKSKVQKTWAKVDDVTDDNLDDNTLGPLNAAHASARARERAAPNSSVGKIAIYERDREAALALTDPILRDQALDNAVTSLEANFGRTLTDDQVDEVNALLDARR